MTPTTIAALLALAQPLAHPAGPLGPAPREAQATPASVPAPPGLPVRPADVVREGWVVGGGLGLATGLGRDHNDLGLSVRVGHSLNPYWIVLYDLEAARVGSGAWLTTHNAGMRWHVTRRVYAVGGLGVAFLTGGGDDEERLGSSGMVGGGVEPYHGHTWALDVQAVYVRSSGRDFVKGQNTLLVTAGIDFY